MLQCVAVCCSVLKCVAVYFMCRSVLWYISVCCTVLRSVAAYSRVLQSLAVRAENHSSNLSCKFLSVSSIGSFYSKFSRVLTYQNLVWKSSFQYNFSNVSPINTQKSPMNTQKSPMITQNSAVNTQKSHRRILKRALKREVCTHKRARCLHTAPTEQVLCPELCLKHNPTEHILQLFQVNSMCIL